MKTVYILLKSVPYEGDQIIGVYEDEKIAEKIAAALGRVDYCNSYEVNIWAVE